MLSFQPHICIYYVYKPSNLHIHAGSLHICIAICIFVVRFAYFMSAYAHLVQTNVSFAYMHVHIVTALDMNLIICIGLFTYRRFNAIVSQLKMHYFSGGAFESLISSQLLKKEKYI